MIGDSTGPNTQPPTPNLQLHLAKRLLEVVGRAAMAGHGLADAVWGPRARYPRDIRPVRRVLVIRLDLLGDVVFSIPTIQSVQRTFPDARVDVLVLPYTAPVVACVPGVGLVHSIDVNQFRRPKGLRYLPSLLEKVFALRRQKYDVALGLSGVTGGLFAVFSGARWRVGYREEAYWGCYNVPLTGRRYRRPQHEVEYCLDLVRGLGIGGCGLGDGGLISPYLPTPERLTLVPGPPTPNPQPLPAPPFAVLVPGASNGAAKRWPAEYWSSLGDRLARERALDIVISGSSSERALGMAVADGMEQACVNLAGETSVEELMDLLSHAAVVVAGDTGPLHLAAALGRPVVGIFGPTDPRNTGPMAKVMGVVRLGLSCSPCYDLRSPADCKLPDRSVACMWGLPPERVYAEVCRVLDETSDEA